MFSLFSLLELRLVIMRGNRGVFGILLVSIFTAFVSASDLAALAFIPGDHTGGPISDCDLCVGNTCCWEACFEQYGEYSYCEDNDYCFYDYIPPLGETRLTCTCTPEEDACVLSSSSSHSA